MSRSILTVNVGSSSVKADLFHAETGTAPQRFARATVTGIPDAMTLRTQTDAGGDGASRPIAPHRRVADHSGQEAAFDAIVDWVDTATQEAPLAAVGHRIVHGGPAFAEPVRVTDAIIDRLAEFIPLAPSHQPHNLAALQTLMAEGPNVPHVACFDTAFHQTQPWHAKTFALPRACYARGIRRYGFHGLSYAYIAEALPVVAGTLPERTVVAHLGHGASLCAMKAGRSIATTMGMTALDGLPMGKRCGALDPGALLHMIETDGMTPGAVSEMLYKHSGLLGLSGESDDMAALLASDSEAAHEAVSYFCHRVREEIGRMAAALEGLDALVFTAGIGEHAAPVRSQVAQGLSWLGVSLDQRANREGATTLHRPDSRVAVYAIPTDEAAMIARQTARLTGLA